MPAFQLRRSGLRSSASILRGSSGHHFRRTKAEGIAGGEILPLPSVDINHPFRWNSLPLSRKVIRRLQKRAHVDGWLDVGISAINSLGGFHSTKASFCLPNWVIICFMSRRCGETTCAWAHPLMLGVPKEPLVSSRVLAAHMLALPVHMLFIERAMWLFLMLGL